MYKGKRSTEETLIIHTTQSKGEYGDEILYKFIINLLNGAQI